MNRKLRAVVLLDTYTVPAWMSLALRQVRDSEFAEVVLVVSNASSETLRAASARPGTGRRGARQDGLRPVLESARRLLMERDRPSNHACRLVDVEGMLKGIPVIDAPGPRRGAADAGFEQRAGQIADRIAEHDADVIIGLGLDELSDRISGAARHGVWAYHLGDSRANRGGPPGYWETMEAWPATGCELYRLSGAGSHRDILYRSWSCTDRKSVSANNNGRLWTAAAFLPRVLRRLHAIGSEGFELEVAEKNRQPEFCSQRVYKEPGNAQLLTGLGKKLSEKIQDRLRREFYFDQWILLYAFGSPLPTQPATYTPLIPPRDRFWADPLAVERDGAHYLFFEELRYADGIGHISCMTIDCDGKCGPVVPVLEEPHHLSYPFIFELDGVTYMLVESLAARTVPLYRCVSFPDKWVFEKNLLEDVAAVDPTLHEHGGKWYLFVNIAEHSEASEWDELFLFCADDPVSGAWQAHPMNPIVSDVRRARPAGPLISWNGALYRPSQDCSHRYGYGLNLNRITRLDPDRYEEVLTVRVKPDWDPRIKAVHAISTTGSLTVLDAQRRRARYW